MPLTYDFGYVTTIFSRYNKGGFRFSFLSVKWCSIFFIKYLNDSPLDEDRDVGVEEGGVIQLDGGDELAAAVAEDVEGGAAEHEDADKQHWKGTQIEQVNRGL